MPFPTLRAVLSLAPLLALASATSVRQIAGDYTLLRGAAGSSCPATLVTPDPVSLSSTPVQALLHRELRAGAAACAAAGADTYTALLTAKEFEARALTPPDRTDALVDALLRTNALFGTEALSDRVCGDFTLRKGALVAYVNSREDANFLGDFGELKDGKTLLLMAEAGVEDPKRCLYVSKNEMEDDSGGGSCFPAAAKMLVGGGVVEAGDVEVGMELVTGRVLAFSHRDLSDAVHAYVRIVPADGGEALLASPGHYLVLEGGGLRAAASVRVGDVLKGSGGGGRRIAAVGRVMARGKVNPHTASGVLHVEGFEVSCYTTAVHPTVARAGVRMLDIAGRLGAKSLASGIADSLREPEKFPKWLMRWVPSGPADLES